MHRNDLGIYPRNMRVFYFVDTFRAMWFVTSVWVVFERQFLTLSQLTFVEAFIVGITLLTQLPTGAFADLFGKRRAMIIGGLLYSASMWFYSFSTTFPMFLVYAVMMGMAQAFIDGTREALLYDTLKQDHEEHLGRRINRDVFLCCCHQVNSKHVFYYGFCQYLFCRTNRRYGKIYHSKLPEQNKTGDTGTFQKYLYQKSIFVLHHDRIINVGQRHNLQHGAFIRTQIHDVRNRYCCSCWPDCKQYTSVSIASHRDFFYPETDIYSSSFDFNYRLYTGYMYDKVVGNNTRYGSNAGVRCPVEYFISLHEC